MVSVAMPLIVYDAVAFLILFALSDVNDQIIVIENTEKKELPKIDFDSRFVKVYTFTKDENNGRYGFLDGVFQN